MTIEVQSVFGASRYLQRITEAPASVTIIDAEEIWRCGYQTLADALAMVRGFYVSSDRRYSFIGTRSFQRPGDYNTHVLLTVDGHRINDNIYDQATIEEASLIALDDVERIEVIRGPSSSLYGSNAFFGVVNVVTRSGRHLGGLEAAAEAGTFGRRGARVAWGGGVGASGGFSIAASHGADRRAGTALLPRVRRARDQLRRRREPRLHRAAERPSPARPGRLRRAGGLEPAQEGHPHGGVRDRVQRSARRAAGSPGVLRRGVGTPLGARLGLERPGLLRRQPLRRLHAVRLRRGGGSVRRREPRPERRPVGRGRGEGLGRVGPAPVDRGRRGPAQLRADAAQLRRGSRPRRTRRHACVHHHRVVRAGRHPAVSRVRGQPRRAARHLRRLRGPHQAAARSHRDPIEEADPQVAVRRRVQGPECVRALVRLRRVPWRTSG